MFILPKLNKKYNYTLLNLKRIIGVFLLIITIVFTAKSQNANNGIKKIVIDPGHGGKDPGNLGTGRYKITEKHIALDISLLFGKYVNESFPEIEVIYTRTTNEEYPTLKERTELANKVKADLFISIHCDAFTNPNAYGAGVFVMGMSKLKANMDIAMKENAVIYLEDDYKQNYDGFDPNTPESYIVFSLTQNTHLGQSLQIAEEVEEQFSSRANRKSRGVKQAPFYVISRANMPSILIECGFLTNPKEEDYLNSKEGKVYLASAIFRAFRSYKMSIDQASVQIENKEAPKNKKENKKVVEKREVNTKPSPKIIFKVQIGTYLKNMTNTKKFLEINTEEIIIHGTYKYFVGNTSSKVEADKLRKSMVEKGFKGAFVIAFNDGIQINVKEALSLQKQ
ncbi:MAG: N-acetylmuramoyl-L-alanine amidase [Flavobacteriales bacterium]|nr:N-acetylmuramoyl-L-alanine amidase [Flavobacteriales bacterium]